MVTRDYAIKGYIKSESVFIFVLFTSQGIKVDGGEIYLKYQATCPCHQESVGLVLVFPTIYVATHKFAFLLPKYGFKPDTFAHKMEKSKKSYRKEESSKFSWSTKSLPFHS